MRPGKTSKTILFLSLILFFTSLSIAFAEKRIALVIGNAAYKSSPLANTVNDAVDMEANLKKCNFDVIKITNADQKTMDSAIDRFYKNLKKSDTGLFYFSGHGMQVDGENYLIPIGANIKSESDVKYEAVNAGRILGRMKDAATPLNIMILDACRDNPYKSFFRSSSRGLARMNAPKGAIVAYAAAPGSVASDGVDRGRNGVFTKHFLNNMMKPGWAIEKVLKQTRIAVSEETGGKQIPEERSLLTGDFIFLAGGYSVVESPVTTTTTVTSAATGSLNVKTEPPGATIFLDDKKQGRAPVTISGLESGNYKIKAELDNYIPQEKKLKINNNRKAVISFFLDPLSTKAKIFVNTTPPDSQVRIMNIVDKFYNGIELDNGRYEIEVSKDGYKMKTQWVEIQNGEDLDLYVELEKEEKVVIHNTSASVGMNTPDAGDIWKEPVTGMEFVWVPGGCYMMGSNSGESDEKPVHEVCLDGFWMGKYEVTQGQWQKIMGNNPSSFRKGDDYPVETVSWNDAQQFISKLNSAGAKIFSLPTEAQWEYAARSGGKNQEYSGSNSIDSVAWYGSNSGGSTHRVGTKAANGLGIYDMSGNVWEWCQDIYAKDAYSKHVRNNPIYAESGSNRVFRGGSWINVPAYVRCASRNGDTPDFTDSSLGFRLSRKN
ncbi:conserved exported hypothetical protein [Desulfamplus magnetovallimortis]|uniref:Caspase family p20 domain-containing protein n=1 Tax=Desulfamplus magnetovallimortis TaxID=1246637 RepID=A0A1W1H4T3_9BACT|nr:SUMF1/EgtB/PvdO family nonheme iron enzyme [Desulfamplus magnetovallimortis]SLM27490.1 conserved exported hypothetical protein [Desulfamplus magnetovallimortis]